MPKIWGALSIKCCCFTGAQVLGCPVILHSDVESHESFCLCKWQKPQRKIIVELSNERPDGQPRAKVGPLDYAYVDMSDAEVEKSARSDLWILDDVQFARRTASADF